MMQGMFGVFPDWLMYTIFGALAILLYFVIDRAKGGARSLVRVEYPGSTEVTVKAKEYGNQVKFVDPQNKQLIHEIPLMPKPKTASRWGLLYRIHYWKYGQPHTTHILSFEDDPELKQNTSLFENQIRAAHTLRELVAGLKRVDKWAIITYMLAGLMAGLWLSPYVDSALGGGG